MDLLHHRLAEHPLIKTKIIATVGPASCERKKLRSLVGAGVDVFRLNFAHGGHDWLAQIVEHVRSIEDELRRPVGLLGDLSGPKIRLGQLPPDGLTLRDGERVAFADSPDAADPRVLTSTYESLIDDLSPGDRVLLADGTVHLRVEDKDARARRAVCVVEQGGLIRTRQGINLPGVKLSTPSLTEKDLDDLSWAISNQLDFVGFSFVRTADDVRLLRQEIEKRRPAVAPMIVAKIEKIEAVGDLERILDVTDAVMVARGDLGVETDIARVPMLQKQIIRLCNQHRIPVITATQMLDSMQKNELPTRAEASDVANAVLDGSDAVMLSGETAIGEHPVRCVKMMNRIAQEAESSVVPSRSGDHQSLPRTRATLMTEAVTLGAATAAEHLKADLIVVATRSGKTAMAVSKQRSPIPILAVTDRPASARRMCLYWGVTPLLTEAVQLAPDDLLSFVVKWGVDNDILDSGSRLVIVGTTDWSHDSKNLMLVHALP